MATIIDDSENVTNEPTTEQEAQTDAPVEEFADLSQDEPSQETQPAETTSDDSEVPDKYRGKSVKEIVAMHQEAEKLLGRQGDEVGQLRKVVDDYIQTEISKRETHETAEEEVDFFTDPDGAMDRKIQSHPAVKKALETMNQYELQTNVSAIRSKYPNAEKYLQDPSFKDWIGGSQYRQALYDKANSMDFNATDEMFGLWEERMSMISNTAEAEKSSRSSQIKQASVGNAKGSRAGAGKKTYRRADIIKLMQTDPERYQEMQPEIYAAYAEGRVK